MSRTADWLPAALLLVGGIGALGVAWVTTGPVSGQYLIVTPPGSTLPATINLVRTARGRIAGMGYFSNIVIANSASADFAVTLRKTGAWLAVPVPALAGCLEPSSKEKFL